MGQYYRIYAENDEGAKVFISYDYKNGAKLMEHSYFGNDFVRAICSTILNNPHRVWWVGDYAGEEGDFAEGSEYVYHNAWNAEEKEIPIIKEAKDFYFEAEWYLINHTKKGYIDLRECRVKNTDKWDFSIHPLPLLTAVGNGRGGGDYRGYENEAFVGSYAGDSLEISAEIPEGYSDHTEIAFFRE